MMNNDTDSVSVVSRFYCCFRCRNILAAHDDIIDKCFQARKKKRAFLFTHVANTAEGEKVDRTLLSGVHTVADLFCAECGNELGWKYEKAHDERNKYKEGKTVLIKSKIANCAPHPIFS